MSIVIAITANASSFSLKPMINACDKGSVGTGGML